MNQIAPGDYSALAAQYVHRPGYSRGLLKRVAEELDAFREGFAFADVGAGTGKLTEDLLAIGLAGVAVEPNDAMRAEGMRQVPESAHLEWRAGSAEATGLADASADWVLMGSSFHWTEAALSLPEFRRILRPGGALSVLWNPRDLERSPWHSALEADIAALVPGLKRRSSGGAKYTKDIETVLTSTGHFADVRFDEADFEVMMTRARYLGAWRSVNDIHAQAGEAKWTEIMGLIEDRVAGLDEIAVPYKTRMWTARRV